MCHTKAKQNKVIHVQVLTQQFNDDVNGDGDEYEYDIRKKGRRFNLV